eukprot:7356768-Prymnesium_polylepis.1
MQRRCGPLAASHADVPSLGLAAPAAPVHPPCHASRRRPPAVSCSATCRAPAPVSAPRCSPAPAPAADAEVPLA